MEKSDTNSGSGSDSDSDSEVEQGFLNYFSRMKIIKFVKSDCECTDIITENGKETIINNFTITKEKVKALPVILSMNEFSCNIVWYLYTNQVLDEYISKYNPVSSVLWEDNGKIVREISITLRGSQKVVFDKYNMMKALSLIFGKN